MAPGILFLPRSYPLWVLTSIDFEYPCAPESTLFHAHAIWAPYQAAPFSIKLMLVVQHSSVVNNVDPRLLTLTSVIPLLDWLDVYLLSCLSDE